MVTRTLSTPMVLGFLLAGILANPSVAIALEVGERAPDFTLPSTTGEQISLSQFRARSWFWLSFMVSISPRHAWRTCRPGRPTIANSRT